MNHLTFPNDFVVSWSEEKKVERLGIDLRLLFTFLTVVDLLKMADCEKLVEPEGKGIRTG